MIEFPASSLQPGDEFTIDDGETWHTVKITRDANKGKRLIVIDTSGHELILKPDQMVITK